jgi:ribosomal 50S subunit-recycling heat shock protein
MRLDKFLKVSRLVKQRPRAKQLCDQNSVKVNGTAVKASYMVKEGDTIVFCIGDRETAAQVLSIPTGNVSRKQASDLVDILGTQWLDDE